MDPGLAATAGGPGKRPRAWHLLEQIRDHIPQHTSLIVVTPTETLSASQDLPPSGVHFVIIDTVAYQPVPPLDVTIRLARPRPGDPISARLQMSTRVVDVVEEARRSPHDPAWDADLGPPTRWILRLTDGTRLSHNLMAIFAAVAHGPHWLLRVAPPRRWHPGLAPPTEYDRTVCSSGPATVVTLTCDGVQTETVPPELAFQQVWQALAVPTPPEAGVAVWWTTNRELVVAWTAAAAQLAFTYPLPASSNRPIRATLDAMGGGTGALVHLALPPPLSWLTACRCRVRHHPPLTTTLRGPQPI